MTGAAPALVAAAGAAVGYGFASILQAKAAGDGSGALATVRHPLYLAGLVLDALAWLASLGALRTLPVYEVQAVLAGSLAVTVVAARFVLGARLRPVDGIAVAVTVVALAVLAAAGGPQEAAHLAGPGRIGLAAAAVPLALAGWVTTRTTAAGAAIVAGLAFGGAALCARAITLPDDPLRHVAASLGSVAANPLVWALAGYGGTGLLLYAYALEHAAVGPATALLWIAEVTAPAVVGVVLLGDTIRPGWTAAAYLALAATVGAAALLAHAPTTTASADRPG